MYRRIFAVVLIIALFIGVLPTAAQSGAICDKAQLSTQLDEYARQITDATDAEIETIRAEIDVLLSDYLNQCNADQPAAAAPSSGEVLFTIIPTGNVNIRSCGDTSCDVVGSATAGQVYNVVGQENDWYQIELANGETGFIASWVTTRGPDDLIDVYTGYFDPELVCYVQATVSRSTSNDLGFAISGAAQNQVVVDIIRPNQTNPEPVWQQYDKTFTDTGDPYIHQVYRSSYWPTGSYQLQLQRDGETRLYGFNLSQQGDTMIFVLCE